jgi:YVTN family beta-propeller protein
MCSMSILIALCSLAVSVGAQPRAQRLAAGDSVGSPRVVFVWSLERCGGDRLGRFSAASARVGFISTMRAAAAANAAVPTPPPLHLKTLMDVPLGGRATRLDYASVDAGRQLLFIAHLGDGEVIVVDTESHRLMKRIANVAQVHGVLAIPELRKVYASATGTNEVVAIDEKSLEVTARMPGGSYPDGLAYSPETLCVL